MAALSDYMEAQIRAGVFRTSTYSARANSTAYALGDRIYLATFDGGFYECVTAGTSAAAAPAYSTTLGADTTDGTAVFRRILPGLPKKALFVALYTAAPSDAGGGTEVSGGAYARVQVNPADANWTAASATDGLTDNAAAITFPTATASWGTVTHVGIHDGLTGGNLLLHGALTTSKTVGNGDTFSFAAGALDVTWA